MKERTHDDAVSPVVAVMLLLAITVVLSTVIGSQLLGMLGSSSTATPQADVQVSEQDGRVTVSVVSMEYADAVRVLYNGETTNLTQTGESETFATSALNYTVVAVSADSQRVIHEYTASTPHAGPPPADHVVAKAGEGDYETIQAAVDAASPGDVIHVEDGTYIEEVSVTKDDLFLYGNGQDAVLTRPSDGCCAISHRTGFDIQGDNVTISSFTIRRFEDGIGANPTGGYTAHNATIVNNNIIGDMSAVAAYGDVDNWNVTNNTLNATEQSVYLLWTCDTCETNGWEIHQNSMEGRPDQSYRGSPEGDLTAKIQDSGVSAGATINATNNWWGDTNPSDQITYNGTSDGEVVYDPWCTTAACE